MKSADQSSSTSEPPPEEGAAPRSTPASSKSYEKTLAQLQQDKRKFEQELIEARAHLEGKAHELKGKMGTFEDNVKILAPLQKKLAS
jgi:hypothetical protein